MSMTEMSEESQIRFFLHRRDGRRKVKNHLMIFMIGVFTLIAVLPLLSILWYVVREGWPALSWDFFTQLPKPVGEVGGGVGNAMLGSLVMVTLASIFGIPIGIISGVYLSEFGRGKIAGLLGFSCDLLISVPSIIVGLFAYTFVVVPMGTFSAYAGAFSLLLIQIPMVARTTEELLKLVPQHLREAGLALGIPRWKVILKVVLRGSLAGLFTGVILTVARIAGETAPILFSAMNNRYWAQGLDQPTASLPVLIYTYAISPYEDWHTQAWGAALILVSFVLILNLVTRAVLGRRPR
jgi:phosphate transport system permease protein